MTEDINWKKNPVNLPKLKLQPLWSQQHTYMRHNYSWWSGELAWLRISTFALMQWDHWHSLLGFPTYCSLQRCECPKRNSPFNLFSNPILLSSYLWLDCAQYSQVSFRQCSTTCVCVHSANVNVRSWIRNGIRRRGAMGEDTSQKRATVFSQEKSKVTSVVW